MSDNKSTNSRFTIRVKLLVVSFLLLVIPITVLGAVTYTVSMRETDELIESSLRTETRLAIEMIGELARSVENGLMTEEAAQETFRRLVLGEKLEDGTRPVNKRIDLGENGYFFVLNERGDLLAHPSLEGQNIWDSQSSDGTFFIRDMASRAAEGGGITKYMWPLPDDESKEALKITYAEQAPAWGWIVAAGSYEQDYNQGQEVIVGAILITLAGCLVVGLVVLTLFARHIAVPIRRVAEQAEAMAAGDLTLEPLDASHRDETGRLAASTNLLLENLKQLAGNMRMGANQLAIASADLARGIEGTVQTANETSAAIAEVAQYSETQARSMEEAARTMEEMATGIQRIAETSSGAYETSAATLEQTESGNELVRQSMEQMAAASQSMDKLNATVGRLDERSRQIGDIAATMKSIADQTAILALNASIEASRAGEQGKGFAVVAAEIRKLAAHSNESAQQVQELTDTIAVDIGQASAAMAEGGREVAEGLSAMENTGAAFERILQATRQTVTHMQEASATAEQMSASSQQIAASMHEVERLSANTSAATQTVSAAAEEQLASMDEMAGAAERLSGMADSMRRTVGSFKL